MSATTTFDLPRPSLPQSGILSRLAAGFQMFTHAVRAGHEVERLMEMSDAELARRGLTRETVGEYAFRTYFQKR